MARDTGPACILAIDDNARNLELLEASLGAAGYRVVTAADGLLGLEAFDAHEPDLVLLDVLMPGMDGFDVCRAIRERPAGRDVAVIFVTVLADLGSHQRALRSGADDFINKPINRTELLIRVRSLLWIKKMRDQLTDAFNVIRSLRDELLHTRLHDLSLTEDLHDAIGDHLRGIRAEAAVEAPPEEVAQRIADRCDAIDQLLERAERSAGAGARFTTLDVESFVADLAPVARRRLASTGVASAFACEPGLEARADADLLRALCCALLNTGAANSPPDGRVALAARAEGEGAVFVVSDEGATFDDAVRDAVLEGAAPIVEAHGGRIWHEPAEPGNRVCVWIGA